MLYAYNKDITLSMTVDSHALITSFSSYQPVPRQKHVFAIVHRVVCA